MKKTAGGKPETSPPKRGYGLSPVTMWVVLIVFVILFLMIRSATHLGGNPLILFLVMFGLFFLVLFFVRLGAVRTRNWWRRTRPGLVRFLAFFVPSNSKRR